MKMSRVRSWSVAAFVVLAVGCAGASAPDEPEACVEPCGVEGPMTEGASDDDGGSTDGLDDDAGSEGGAAAAGGLPCDVVDVLARNCGECHGTEPKFGAPMPLASYDDFQIPAVTDPARPVHAVVAERIATDDRPMPPIEPMSDADREVLADWIDAGAQLDPTADCGPADGPSDDTDELPCVPDVVMTAHGADPNEAYAVPESGADNLYMCFAFKSPFAAGAQATAWAPVIDDERVVHHWILYRTKLPQVSAGPFPCDVTLQVTTDFVAGWAPGGGTVVLPDDVGLDLGGPDDWYILQLHYNNTAGYADALDRSGVAFCTAEEERPNMAGIVSLGSLGIAIPPGAQDHDVVGVCSGLHTLFWPDMHIIGASPHMHELGTAMQSTVHRIDGTKQDLMANPAFDFSNQGMHFPDEEIIVHPGDSIITTCTYDNPHAWPVLFGEGTNDEMCFNFVLAYPVNTLLDRNCGILL